MTSPRPPDRLEVPVERLAGGRGQGRRATAVAAAIVALVGGAFGLARWSEGVSAPADRSAGPVRASAEPASPSAPASARAPGARVERLLPIGRVALPGAPEVTLAERAGDGTALRIEVWTPDDGRIRTIRVVRGVVPPEDEAAASPVVAPNRAHVALLTASTTGDPDGDTASVVGDDGSVVWTGTRVVARSGALWSSDSRLVVVAGRPRVWHLIALDRPGHATDHVVHLPGEVYLPTPVPRGWLTVSPLEPRTVPLGFSADDAWIYGAVISPDLGMLIGAFRVAADGSRVEPLADVRVGRPDGLVPRPGTLGTRTVDPGSGRVATSRINADTTGGPQTVEVRAPDASHLFDLGGGVALGWEWGGDGSLYALTGDTILYADSIELHRVDADGTSGPALLTTGPLTGGALIGVRDGFAVVALLATRPDHAAQLVSLDLAHPERRTALPFDVDGGLLGVSLDR